MSDVSKSDELGNISTEDEEFNKFCNTDGIEVDLGEEFQTIDELVDEILEIDSIGEADALKEKSVEESSGSEPIKVTTPRKRKAAQKVSPDSNPEFKSQSAAKRKKNEVSKTKAVIEVTPRRCTRSQDKKNALLITTSSSPTGVSAPTGSIEVHLKQELVGKTSKASPNTRKKNKQKQNVKQEDDPVPESSTNITAITDSTAFDQKERESINAKNSVSVISTEVKTNNMKPQVKQAEEETISTASADDANNLYVKHQITTENTEKKDSVLETQRNESVEKEKEDKEKESTSNNKTRLQGKQKQGVEEHISTTSEPQQKTEEKDQVLTDLSDDNKATKSQERETEKTLLGLKTPVASQKESFEKQVELASSTSKISLSESQPKEMKEELVSETSAQSRQTSKQVQEVEKVHGSKPSVSQAEKSQLKQKQHVEKKVVSKTEPQQHPKPELVIKDSPSTISTVQAELPAKSEQTCIDNKNKAVTDERKSNELQQQKLMEKKAAANIMQSQQQGKSKQADEKDLISEKLPGPTNTNEAQQKQLAEKNELVSTQLAAKEQADIKDSLNRSQQDEVKTNEHPPQQLTEKEKGDRGPMSKTEPDLTKTRELLPKQIVGEKEAVSLQVAKQERAAKKEPTSKTHLDQTKTIEPTPMQQAEKKEPTSKTCLDQTKTTEPPPKQQAEKKEPTSKTRLDQTKTTVPSPKQQAEKKEPTSKSCPDQTKTTEPPPKPEAKNKEVSQQVAKQEQSAKKEPTSKAHPDEKATTEPSLKRQAVKKEPTSKTRPDQKKTTEPSPKPEAEKKEVSQQVAKQEQSAKKEPTSKAHPDPKATTEPFPKQQAAKKEPTSKTRPDQKKSTEPSPKPEAENKEVSQQVAKQEQSAKKEPASKAHSDPKATTEPFPKQQAAKKEPTSKTRTDQKKSTEPSPKQQAEKKEAVSQQVANQEQVGKKEPICKTEPVQMKRREPPPKQLVEKIETISKIAEPQQPTKQEKVEKKEPHSKTQPDQTERSPKPQTEKKGAVSKAMRVEQQAKQSPAEKKAQNNTCKLAQKQELPEKKQPEQSKQDPIESKKSTGKANQQQQKNELTQKKDLVSKTSSTSNKTAESQQKRDTTNKKSSVSQASSTPNKTKKPQEQPSKEQSKKTDTEAKIQAVKKTVQSEAKSDTATKQQKSSGGNKNGSDSKVKENVPVVVEDDNFVFEGIEVDDFGVEDVDETFEFEGMEVDDFPEEWMVLDNTEELRKQAEIEGNVKMSSPTKEMKKTTEMDSRTKTSQPSKDLTKMAEVLGKPKTTLQPQELKKHPDSNSKSMTSQSSESSEKSTMAKASGKLQQNLPLKSEEVPELSDAEMGPDRQINVDSAKHNIKVTISGKVQMAKKSGTVKDRLGEKQTPGRTVSVTERLGDMQSPNTTSVKERLGNKPTPIKSTPMPQKQDERKVITIEDEPVEPSPNSRKVEVKPVADKPPAVEVNEDENRAVCSVRKISRELHVDFMPLDLKDLKNPDFLKVLSGVSSFSIHFPSVKNKTGFVKISCSTIEQASELCTELKPLRLTHKSSKTSICNVSEALAAKAAEKKKKSESDVKEEKEAKSNTSNDLHPEFVPGMVCPVERCGLKKYNTYQQMLTHWNRFHCETIPGFQCVHCTFLAPAKWQILHHLKTHGLSQKQIEEDFLKLSQDLVSMPNHRMIEPGDHLCPQNLTADEEGGEAAAIKNELATAKKESTIQKKQAPAPKESPVPKKESSVIKKESLTKKEPVKETSRQDETKAPQQTPEEPEKLHTLRVKKLPKNVSERELWNLSTDITDVKLYKKAEPPYAFLYFSSSEILQKNFFRLVGMSLRGAGKVLSVDMVTPPKEQKQIGAVDEDPRKMLYIYNLQPYVEEKHIMKACTGASRVVIRNTTKGKKQRYASLEFLNRSQRAKFRRQKNIILYVNDERIRTVFQVEPPPSEKPLTPAAPASTSTPISPPVQPKVPVVSKPAEAKEAPSSATTQDKGIDDCIVYVNELPDSITENDLNLAIPEVSKVRIPKDMQGNPLGCAILEFPGKAIARVYIQKQKVLVKNRYLILSSLIQGKQDGPKTKANVQQNVGSSTSLLGAYPSTIPPLFQQNVGTVASNMQLNNMNQALAMNAVSGGFAGSPRLPTPGLNPLGYNPILPASGFNVPPPPIAPNLLMPPPGIAIIQTTIDPNKTGPQITRASGVRKQPDTTAGNQKVMPVKFSVKPQDKTKDLIKQVAARKLELARKERRSRFSDMNAPLETPEATPVRSRSTGDQRTSSSSSSSSRRSRPSERSRSSSSQSEVRRSLPEKRRSPVRQSSPSRSRTRDRRDERRGESSRQSRLSRSPTKAPASTAPEIDRPNDDSEMTLRMHIDMLDRLEEQVRQHAVTQTGKLDLVTVNYLCKMYKTVIEDMIKMIKSQPYVHPGFTEKEMKTMYSDIESDIIIHVRHVKSMAYGTNNARIDELVVLLKDLQDIARLNIVKIDILLSESMSDKSRISAADKRNPVKRKFQDNSGSSFETNKISVDYGHRSQNQTLDWGSEVPPKVRALDPYPSRPGNYQRHLEMEQRRFEEEIQPRESVGTRHSTSEYDVNKNSKTGRKGGNLGLSLLQQYEDDADADAGDADIRRSDQHSATNTYGSQARSQSNVYGYSTPNIFSVPPPPLPVKNVKMPVGILKKSSTSGPNDSTNTYKQGYSNQSPVSNQNIGIASSGSQYGYPVSSAVGSSSMSYSNQGPSSSSAVQQNLHSNPPPLSLGDFFVTKVIIGDFMIEKLAPLPKTKIVPFPHLNIGGITAKIRLQCNIVKGYEDILILVGANDIQNTSLTEMIINLKTLIAVIQMINSSAHIFISSMIPRNQENRLVNRKIEQYNSQLDGEFNDEKVTYLQTCKKFQSMAKPVPGYFEMDGIHLNGHGLKVLHGYFGNVLL